MAKILSFNTTDQFIYLMLQENDKILYETKIDEVQKHSELLIPSIEALLKQFNLHYDDLGAVSVINGPGNFIGLRVGMSVAKGIDISASVPIITINMFELVLRKRDLATSMVVLKANLGNYYIKDPKKSEPYVLNYKELSEYVSKNKSFCVLTNDDEVLKLPNAKKFVFDFNDWAKLVYQKYQDKQFDNEIKPLYIRPAQTTARKK